MRQVAESNFDLSDSNKTDSNSGRERGSGKGMLLLAIIIERIWMRQSCLMGDVWRHAARASLLLALLFSCGVLSGCHSFRRQPVERDVAASRELSLRGLEAMQSGRASEAEDLFSKAVDACPRDDRARKRYADALLARGAIDEAIAQMEHAIRLSGDDPQLRVELGEIYLVRGDIEYADKLAKETIRKNNQLASAWALQGKVHLQLGDLDNALAAFHRSISYDQRDPEVQIMIARIYRQQQRPLRAYSTIQRLAKETPPEAIDAELRALQGLALKDLGRLGQAAYYLREAMALDPNSSELYYYLAETLLMDGDRANAQLTIAQGRERFPEDQGLIELANRQLVLPGEYRPPGTTIR